MCRPVTCKKCQKTTWAGCGKHVESVKAQVPAGQWCNCRSGATQEVKTYSGSLDSVKNRFLSWFGK